jgi:hypothetical protein
MEQEIKDYLFNSCTPDTIEKLANWISTLKTDGIPQKNKWVGVNIELFPCTVLNPPSFVFRFVSNESKDRTYPSLMEQPQV